MPASKDFLDSMKTRCLGCSGSVAVISNKHVKRNKHIIYIHPSSEIVYYPANRDFLAEPESLVSKTMTISISFPSDFLEYGMKSEKRLIKLFFLGYKLQI